MDMLLDFKIKKQKELQPFINNVGFNWACSNGELEIAKWLVSVKPDIYISENNENAFNKACEYGYLELAKWLLLVKPDINISVDNEKAFRYACINGKLIVAQWLLSIKPDINISVEDEYAFCGACENNELEVAQWLLSVKPDINISIDCDNVFKLVCESNLVEIAQWLSTLNETYHIEVEDDEIINYYVSIISMNINYTSTIIIDTYTDIEDKKFIKEMCCVCYEPSNLKTDCNHYGCHDCFVKLNNICPYCRQKIKEYYKIKFLENKFLEKT